TPNKDHDIWLDLDRSRQKVNNDDCQLGSLDGMNRNCNAPQANAYYGYKDSLRFNRDQIALGHTSRFSFGTVESSIMRSTTETLGRTIPSEARPARDPSIGTDRELKTTNTVFDTKLVAPVGDSHVLTVGGQYGRPTTTHGLVTEQYDQNTRAPVAEDGGS